ncbi:hypothetical protein VPH13_12845 [Stenotrophomonas pavanii]|uniref:hypothetical protein n=1 Tax=Stenotrophomonas pavanii TaxID=487698 RepID=UPI002DB8203C|nr:hypothetical protein [Stenotrophomonas pavanii]MEC4339603.1 hypothetical protein [Stenotrophomonas pavanii]
MIPSNLTPVAGAVLSTSSHGQQVVTCQAGSEESACVQWNGERLYPAAVVGTLLLQLDAAGASPTLPTPVAGAVLETSKHGQLVVTCPSGAEDAHCTKWKAQRLYSATTVQALQQLLTAANGEATPAVPMDLHNLKPVRGVVVEVVGQCAVLCRRGEEDEYCEKWQAERVFTASCVEALQQALAASQANELRLQSQLDTLRGQQQLGN